VIHRRLLHLAGVVPGAILGLAALGIVLSVLSVLFAVCLAAVIAALAREDGDPMLMVVLLTVVAALRGGVVWLRERLATHVGAGVRMRLRARLLDRLASVPPAERDAGRAAATIIDGVDGLDAYYTRYLPQLVVVLIVPAGVVVLTWTYSAGAGIVLAGAATVGVLAPRLWDARLLRTGRGRWEMFATLSSDWVEALQQIPLLRSFGATGRVALHLGAGAERVRATTMAQLRLSLVETAVSALAMHLGTVLAVAAGAVAVTSGSADAVVIVTVLMLARECFRPVQDLGSNWHAGYLGLTAVDGLDALLGHTPAVTESGTHDEPAPAGVLSLDGVSYFHPGTTVGIRELTLHLAEGETLAVVGASGSGKSTVARLLEREMDPDRGSVRIDGTNLRDYTADARVRSVVVVPQDPALFAWTVRENLRLYRPDATETEIRKAAMVADIHQTILALPEGYNTVLSEDGQALSGGQRQRLAIARAVLSPAPVLVFDEVTSALDMDTERRVVDALARAMPDRTVVVIAHRDSACRHATRWIQLQHGRIHATGSGPPAGRGTRRASLR
jgi:ABC-type transport system involved in cytochrome bd biosynthesis fused ATPase/permease subunit